jgi:hypothetical protein
LAEAGAVAPPPKGVSICAFSAFWSASFFTAAPIQVWRR